jgi:hypothetical protein
MPAEMSFIAVMPGGPFRPAKSCPAMKDMPGEYFSHHGMPDNEKFLVADAATKDASAAVRIVTWRCQHCGVQLVGIGRQDGDLDADMGEGVHAQRFTWLEEIVTKVKSG